MKTKYKLREGVTKETLLGTKWDQSDWGINQKTFWQETMFELGFSWCGETTYQFRYRPVFWCDNFMELTQCKDIDYFFSDEAKQLYWLDIFEEITPEQCTTSSQEALSEDLNTKEYKYTLKEFKHAWEALKHFTEQGGLYYLDYKGEYSLCMNDQDVLTLHRTGRVYIKEELQWWETVSEKKPCWVWFDNSLHIVNRFKEEFLVTTLNKYLDPAECLPLTKEQVQDIVKTQESWYEV